jgi:hypothetical protein
MKEFKIRCSAIGEIMAGQIGLTEAQAKYRSELLARTKPLTDKMQSDLADLNARFAQNELPQSAKTYCLNWIKEQLYQKRKDFSSKFTEKGILMESEAIEFCSEQLGWGMVSKNTESFEDAFMTGEPDVILGESVEDIKCSWDCFTFPLFHNDCDQAYYWQLQGYMYLTGKKKAGVNYVLMDAPEQIVDIESKREAYASGEMDVTTELWDSVCARMSYAGIDPKLRHKRYAIEFNQDAVNSVCERVELCRQYIGRIMKTLELEGVINS